MTFDKKKMNDNYYAKLLSKQIGTSHHAYELDYKDGFSNLHELLKIFDEPIGDSAIIPSYFLSKKAKEHNIKVMLSGAGGDEIFGGYRRYFRSLRDIVSGSLNFIPNNFNIMLSKLSFVKLSHICFLLGSSSTAYGTSISGMNLGISSLLFKENMITGFIDNFEKYKFNKDQSYKNFSLKRMEFDINNYLVNDILALTDKASMASSVEVRVPFLDHRLVELIFSNNNVFQNLTNTSNSKYFLKKILSDTLSAEIINRKKEGFNCPISSWVYQDFLDKQFIKQRLMNLSCDFLKENFIKSAFEKIYNNKKLLLYSAETLFLIYTLDYWFEHNSK
jgi:asparagine synthase (glutamine-hydrolysing)